MSTTKKPNKQSNSVTTTTSGNSCFTNLTYPNLFWVDTSTTGQMYTYNTLSTTINR